MVLSVADTGPGLPPATLDHLFDAFWTTKAEGLGLGLAISRTLVEANGGQITAGADAGGGAVFRVSLPIAGGAP
jgi:signal transduction histidine kinase